MTLDLNDKEGSERVNKILDKWSELCQDQIAEECFYGKEQEVAAPPKKKYKHVPAKDLEPKGLSYNDDRTYNCQVIRGKKPVFK